MLEPMQALEPVDVLEPGAHRSAPGGRVRPRRTVGRRRGVRPVARVVSSIDRIAASHRRSSGVSVGTARPVGARPAWAGRGPLPVEHSRADPLTYC
ncbi:hypothetical protein D092_08395 [Rhodococcus ruber Chol-4]|uniref:Uncharacterized protein n=1 Tax=Rhodococcus ruber TaxID=1830 RepID=A0A098BDW3_9NOCA|nr:hypothetical protein [Rhodococcus sp. A5(2022)]AXY52401.1 hypothetical protein YT1_2992 [Rhodococcus ruber]KXF87441.1 hypothetical protein D092_08395 [Rhodococcus ruber Chol-4]MCZ1073923.1 hypothetical protein [Rhodococcus sp. A5(2022)]RQM32728.1 hypothetical protein TN91_18935 [Rhodococcus ruber]CDZ86914.1 hypothetical protein RHRU231_150003 [Rhodococcus ruber]